MSLDNAQIVHRHFVAQILNSVKCAGKVMVSFYISWLGHLLYDISTFKILSQQW